MVDENNGRTPQNEHKDVLLYANIMPAPHGPIQEGSLKQYFLLVPMMLAVAQEIKFFLSTLNEVYFFLKNKTSRCLQ